MINIDRPNPKFIVGDRVVHVDSPTLKAVVTAVVQECVQGEWREYIEFKNGVGNAELFKKQ